MSSKKGTGSPETRERILETALALVKRQGVAATRIADIARESGVSRQAVYLHFGTRAELFVAMVSHLDATGDLTRHIQAIFDAPSGIDAIDALVHAQAQYNPQIREIADALDSARLSEEAAQAAWQDRMEARRRGCAMIIERLANEGLLAPGWSKSDATDFLWTLSSIRVWRDLVVERGWSSRKYEQHLARVAHASLLSGEPSKPVRRRRLR